MKKWEEMARLTVICMFLLFLSFFFLKFSHSSTLNLSLALLLTHFFLVFLPSFLPFMRWKFMQHMFKHLRNQIKPLATYNDLGSLSVPYSSLSQTHIIAGLCIRWGACEVIAMAATQSKKICFFFWKLRKKGLNFVLALVSKWTAPL